MFEKGHKKLGGRKKGTKNKKALMCVEDILANRGVNPIEKLIDIAESVESTVEQKIKCWQEICKYTHPKLKSQEIRTEPDAVDLIEVKFI